MPFVDVEGKVYWEPDNANAFLSLLNKLDEEKATLAWPYNFMADVAKGDNLFFVPTPCASEEDYIAGIEFVLGRGSIELRDKGTARTLIHLHYCEGMSYYELDSMLGTSDGTAKEIIDFAIREICYSPSYTRAVLCGLKYYREKEAIKKEAKKTVYAQFHM